MFNKLGVNWAGSLLGFLGIAFLPIPFLFYKYGERLRKHSSYAVSQYPSSLSRVSTNVKQPTDFFKKLEDEESKASESDESKRSKSE
jgi:hypothetical protein